MIVKLKPTTERILFDWLLITVVIFIPYHQVSQHTFTDYDDNGYLFANYYVRLGLCWESIVWAFTSTELANWHPLTWLTHLVDHDLFGSHAGGYLLMNVAWHILAACLCYQAFFRCTKSRVFALTVALIFALHPANVENVAWASERKSLVNAVFWFAAVISYVDFIETKTFKAYGLTIIFFILSLFAKAMSVTLPCTLALIHCLYLIYHPENGRASPLALRSLLSKIARPTLPLLVLSAYFSAVTVSAQTIAMPEQYSLQLRLINALESYQRYLVMFFHPTKFALFYPIDFDRQIDFRPALAALLILTVITIATTLVVRKKPQLLIGWCWFLGTLVPVIGLVQTGEQSHADRYLYIPMLGLAFIFPVLLEMIRSLGRMAKQALNGVSISILGISLAAATQIQVSYWRDGVTVCLHSLDVTGYCFQPVLGLYLTCDRIHRYVEFLAVVDAQIAAAESSADKAIMVMMKAKALYSSGQYLSALATAQRVGDWDFTNKTVFAIIALSCLEVGQLDKAAQYLEKAKLAPANNDPMLKFPFNAELHGLEIYLRSIKSSVHAPTEQSDGK